jgi:hypothetical protein
MMELDKDKELKKKVENLVKRLVNTGINRNLFACYGPCKTSWADVGEKAKLAGVAGEGRPDEGDPGSVKSAVENATNILFVAEGFRNERQQDYRLLIGPESFDPREAGPPLCAGVWQACTEDAWQL